MPALKKILDNKFAEIEKKLMSNYLDYYSVLFYIFHFQHLVSVSHSLSHTPTYLLTL